MDERELNTFLARLNNVADEPKAVKPRPRPYPVAVDPTPFADNAAVKSDGWGGKAQTPPRERASSPTDDENLAYLNALTSIKVIFNDGREVVTTIQKVDEVIEEEKETRRRASRRVGR